MSADIMSTQAPLTSTRLKLAGSKASSANQLSMAPSPPDDPALIVGLALTCSRQGQSGTRAIPTVLLDRLRHLARSGDPACRLVQDYLKRRTGANDRTAASQGVPTEIVSVHSAVQEEC